MKKSLIITIAVLLSTSTANWYYYNSSTLLQDFRDSFKELELKRELEDVKNTYKNLNNKIDLIESDYYRNNTPNVINTNNLMQYWGSMWLSPNQMLKLNMDFQNSYLEHETSYESLLLENEKNTFIGKNWEEKLKKSLDWLLKRYERYIKCWKENCPWYAKNSYLNKVKEYNSDVNTYIKYNWEDSFYKTFVQEQYKKREEIEKNNKEDKEIKKKNVKSKIKKKEIKNEEKKLEKNNKINDFKCINWRLYDSWWDIVPNTQCWWWGWWWGWN